MTQCRPNRSLSFCQQKKRRQLWGQERYNKRPVIHAARTFTSPPLFPRDTYNINRPLPPPLKMITRRIVATSSRRIASQARPSQARSSAVAAPRQFHNNNNSRRALTTTSASSPSRPTLLHHPPRAPGLLQQQQRRTIFIQTEGTPNPDALKFLPNHRVLPEGLPTPFIEYLSPRSTIAPPYPSPLAAQLMNVDGVKAVFYGADFITVTKDADAHWAHIRPEVFALITEAVTGGHTIVNVAENRKGDGGAEGGGAEAGGGAGEVDSLAYDENDSEVVGMIKELLETRIRPAIQEDGGDIEFRGFENGHVLLKLRGACRTCDSSTVTLKNGIEGMLMHYVSAPWGSPLLHTHQLY